MTTPDPTREPEPLCPICGTHHRKPHPDSNLDWLCPRNDMTTPAAAPTTAWLVELRDRGVCRGWLRGGYVVDDRNFGWTLDPNAAIRFCRKVDADAYRERHGFTATAESCTHLSTEHMWIDREQRDPTPAPADDLVDWLNEMRIYEENSEETTEAFTRTIARIAADAEIIRGLREALRSIAANTCCERCQEAALVARAARAARAQGEE